MRTHSYAMRGNGWFIMADEKIKNSKELEFAVFYIENVFG